MGPYGHFYTLLITFASANDSSLRAKPSWGCLLSPAAPGPLFGPCKPLEAR